MVFVLLLLGATVSKSRSIGKKRRLNEEHVRGAIAFDQVERVGESFVPVPQSEAVAFTGNVPTSPRNNDVRSGVIYSGVSRFSYPEIAMTPKRSLSSPFRKGPETKTRAQRTDTVVKLLGRTSGGLLGELPRLPRRIGNLLRTEIKSKTRDRALVSYEISDGEGNSNFRQEHRDENGTIRGSYGYQDTDGLYRIVDYEAGYDGYRARIRSNEPGVGSRNPAGVDLAVENSPPEVVARYRKSQGVDRSSSQWIDPRRPSRQPQVHAQQPKPQPPRPQPQSPRSQPQSPRPQPQSPRPQTQSPRPQPQSPRTQPQSLRTQPQPLSDHFQLNQPQQQFQRTIPMRTALNTEDRSPPTPRPFEKNPVFVPKGEYKGPSLGLTQANLMGIRKVNIRKTSKAKSDCRCESLR